MLVYRIALAQFATSLKASGRAARWNPNDIEVIYTASSRSLACLENVVHRSQLGLSQLFNVMTIEIDDRIKKERIQPTDLPADWKSFYQMPFTQGIGEKWIKAGKSALLQVPSSIIDEETNYLINPHHPDFGKMKLIKSVPFIFDPRIKQ